MWAGQIDLCVDSVACVWSVRGWYSQCELVSVAHVWASVVSEWVNVSLVWSVKG